MIPSRLKRSFVALCCGVALVGPAAAACVYRPVTLLVPYPAGGLSDVIARTLNVPLSQQLGQPVLVENLGGAGGSIAAQKALSAPADGHMLFLGSPNEVILTPLANAAVKLRHDQFTLVGPVTVNPLVLLVRKDLPVRSVDELVTYARNPANKPLSYGSVGYGSLYHFAGEELSARVGVQMLHVPYKGGAPLLQDMGSGQVDFTMMPWATMYRGLAQDGRLRIAGWVGPRRDELAPDVPAFGEGTLLKDFEYSTWAGVMVRKETPPATLACLHQALSNVLTQPEIKQAILNTGSRPAAPQSLDESARRLVAEAARFQALAKTIHLQPQ
ncbi:tripartite tricarboxylate transporter substrate binding protein [Variovorax sp. J22R24]|uniref:tripartite tricarboxylate transporter substrate binding protein n=1 Tax=Variovorax gracilis TaxID=3053502 RepID=UPI002578A32A|nr:tripartite tricarboxylate transporter substrate binding protein [Variovorax sp. J22R24]MDM0109661.1 tripartite tricarboxylate transporter substrate binding protein [Variovorax sp. J22R24]